MRSIKVTQSQAGYLVETRDGRKGRTCHAKKLINNKVPVYIESEPGKYSEIGTLINPENLKLIGFVD